MPGVVVREEYIHSSAVVLHALGRIGGTLIASSPDPATWRLALAGLQRVDWRRSAPHWEGRAVTGGRLAKFHASVLLTTDAIRSASGMALPETGQQPDEEP
jgi:DNA sulfur modification protein DndB